MSHISMVLGRFFHAKVLLFTLRCGNHIDTYPVFEPMLGAYVALHDFFGKKRQRCQSQEELREL